MSGLNLEAPEAIQRSRLLLRCTVAGASRRAFKTLISPQSTPQIRGWLPPLSGSAGFVAASGAVGEAGGVR